MDPARLDTARAFPPEGAGSGSPETCAVEKALEAFGLQSSYGLAEAKAAALAQAKAANVAGSVFYAGFLAAVADLEKEVPPGEFSYEGSVTVSKKDKETGAKTTEQYRYQTFSDYRERRAIKAEDKMKRPITLSREFKEGLALYLSCVTSVYKKIGRDGVLTLDLARERASDPADPLPVLEPLLFMEKVVGAHKSLLGGSKNLKINIDFIDILKDAMKALYPPPDTTFYAEAAAIVRDYYKCLAYYAASRAVTKKIASARLPLLCDLTRCLEAPCCPRYRGLGKRLFACVPREAPAARGKKKDGANADDAPADDAPADDAPADDSSADAEPSGQSPLFAGIPATRHAGYAAGRFR